MSGRGSRSASVNGPCCSAHSSAAGSTTMTPSSDTREVGDRDDAEVPEHADVGGDQGREAGDRGGARGEHRRARGGVGELDRARRARAALPLLPVAGGQEHAELGGDRDHEGAERDRHRVQVDLERPRQQAEQEQEPSRPARGQRDRDQGDGRLPARAAHRQQHEEHGSERRQQRQVPPPRRRQRPVRLGGEHRQPDNRRLHALGRVEPALDVVDHVLLAVERHQPDAEGHVRRLAVARDDPLREVRGHDGQELAHVRVLARRSRR